MYTWTDLKNLIQNKKDQIVINKLKDTIVQIVHKYICHNFQINQLQCC